MRNLLEYPITIEEQIIALDWAVKKANLAFADHPGTVIPAALQDTLDGLREAQKHMNEMAVSLAIHL